MERFIAHIICDATKKKPFMTPLLNNCPPIWKGEKMPCVHKLEFVNYMKVGRLVVG